MTHFFAIGEDKEKGIGRWNDGGSGNDRFAVSVFYGKRVNAAEETGGGGQL